MTRDTLRDILFEYLNRLEIEDIDVDVDSVTEEFLSEMDDANKLTYEYSDE